jgi:hypothetical protein
MGWFPEAIKELRLLIREVGFWNSLLAVMAILVSTIWLVHGRGFAEQARQAVKDFRKYQMRRAEIDAMIDRSSKRIAGKAGREPSGPEKRAKGGRR